MKDENQPNLRELARNDVAFKQLQHLLMAHETAYQQAQSEIKQLKSRLELSGAPAMSVSQKTSGEPVVTEVRDSFANLTIRIRSSLNLGEILNTTVSEVRSLLDCDRVIIYRFLLQDSGVVVVESVDPHWGSMLAQTIPDLGGDVDQKYRQGEYVAIDDIYTASLEKCHTTILTQFNVRASLAVPIVQDGGELWGLLIAHHCANSHSWEKFEIDLVISLASVLFIAIEQATLYRQTQLQAKKAQNLNHFTQIIRASLDLETILATAAREISQLLSIDRVEIQQYLPERGCWLTVADYSHSSDVVTSLGTEVVVQDKIDRQLKRLEVVRIDHSNKEVKSHHPWSSAQLLVPLHFQNVLWGYICLTIDLYFYQWHDSHVELVCAIATQLASAIQQAQLYQQLTDLNLDLERQVQQRTIELQQKVRELQDLNIVKDDFLSTVSHELRTPLANMKMAIQMLKLSPSAERSHRYLEILQAECNRETDLINDLLDLQRLEAASFPLLLNETVNLYNWVPNIVEPFRSRLQERQQTIIIEMYPDLPMLITDPTGLGRLLAELLNNACKYTAAEGQIFLRVAKTVNFVTISLSNQGNIPSNALTRIFEKFYRVPHADLWKQGGTGLGLALVQKLVLQLGGEIHVESNDGWTVFTVQLPACEN